MKGIDKSSIPRHVAVIMDGNGRWAARRGKPRTYGHQHAMDAILEVIQAGLTLGIRYLTFYTFSMENWHRPKEEVDTILTTLLEAIDTHIGGISEHKIQVRFVGDLSRFSDKVQAYLQKVERCFEGKAALEVLIALNYSGRWEIVETARHFAKQVLAGHMDWRDIDEKTFGRCLPMGSHGASFPELLIRTSGEMRISNFLLWQIAYTELYITRVLWPDFKRRHFYQAIRAYQRRERRFGALQRNNTPSQKSKEVVLP